jgi:hypothetical protein
VPDPTTVALTASQHCAALSALTLDIAAVASLIDVYNAQGNMGAIEGCRQTIRKAVEATEEHLGFFRELAK